MHQKIQQLMEIQNRPLSHEEMKPFREAVCQKGLPGVPNPEVMGKVLARFVGKRVHKEKNLNRKWELKQQIDDYEANNVSRDEGQEAYERYKQWIRAMEEEDCREQGRMFLVLKSIGELFDPAVLSTMEMGGARLLTAVPKIGGRPSPNDARTLSTRKSQKIQTNRVCPCRCSPCSDTGDIHCYKLRKHTYTF